MTPEEFYQQFHEWFKEAWIDDDPSVGIVSPFYAFYRTTPSTWIVEMGGGETFAISINDVSAAFKDMFASGRQEGMMDAMDEGREEQERLYETIDDLQHQIRKLKDET